MRYKEGEGVVEPDLPKKGKVKARKGRIVKEQRLKYFLTADKIISVSRS